MNYNPTVDYRSDQATRAPDTPREPRSRVTELATRVALSVAVAVWAVVGFFLWVPLLLRRIVVFVVELTYVTLTGGDPDPAAGRLRNAAGFYRRGFVTAVESVLSPREDTRDEKGAATSNPATASLPHASSRRPAPSPSASPARPILQELAWALILWYPVLLWVGIAELTPADVWNAAAAVPWSEVGAEYLGAAAGWAEAFADGVVARVEALGDRLGL